MSLSLGVSSRLSSFFSQSKNRRVEQFAISWFHFHFITVTKNLLPRRKREQGGIPNQSSHSPLTVMKSPDWLLKMLHRSPRGTSRASLHAWPLSLRQRRCGSTSIGHSDVQCNRLVPVDELRRGTCGANASGGGRVEKAGEVGAAIDKPLCVRARKKCIDELLHE